MKLLNITTYLLIAMFGLFAYWQANDPDGPVWIAIYIVAAAVTWGSWRSPVGRWIARGFCLAAFAGGIWLLPVSLVNWIEIEEAREGFGLLICAVVTGALSIAPASLTPSQG